MVKLIRFAPLSETRRITRCRFGPVTVMVMAPSGHYLLRPGAVVSGPLRERFGRRTAVQPSRRSRASFDLILRSVSHALRDCNSIVFALDPITRRLITLSDQEKVYSIGTVTRLFQILGNTLHPMYIMFQQ